MKTNIERVQAIYAAFGAGDVPTILAHLAEDVDWEHDWSGARLPLFRHRHGRAQVAGFFESLAALEINRFEITNFLAGRDQVAAVLHFGARVRASGRQQDDLEMHLWTFGPDSLVTRFRHFSNTWSFAVALGLSPQPSQAG